MNRLEKVREYVDEIIMNQENLRKKRSGFVHLYGVSTMCTILAKKRNLNVEICSICGMLHDIYKYRTLSSVDHGKLGSIDARKILTELNCFTKEEIDVICSTVYHHSDKDVIDGPYDELLKDADVLQHYLYNTSDPVQENEEIRLTLLLKELNL